MILVTDGKEYVDPGGGQITRAMVRCTLCRAWWSTAGRDDLAMCPCGGLLELVDMEAHIAALPQGKDPRAK